MKYFDRKYRLTVGKQGERGIILTGLQFRFKAMKTLTKEPNSLEGDIYNLSPDSRRYFVKDALVTLEVAYGDDNYSTLFVGSIVNVRTYLSAPDLITHFDAGDAYTKLRDSKSSRNFPANSTVESIVRTIASDMGLALGPLNNGTLGASSGLKRVYKRGWAFTGNSKGGLDTVLSSNGLLYSIDEGTLSVTPIGNPNQEAVILLDQTTGLIGAPELIEYDNKEDKPKATKTDDKDTTVKNTVKRLTYNGIRFKTLLNPELRCSRRVKVESKMLNHVATIQQVIHTGDFRGNEWSTECEALI